MAMTTGILIGIGETREERIDALLAIRDVHERYGNVQEVIVQNFRAKNATRMRGAPEPSTVEMLRTLAAARLLLGPDMGIQAPPNLNADGCGAYLLAGINDWGGVSPLTKDFINPEAAWPELGRLRLLTAEAGYELRERTALYPRVRDGRGLARVGAGAPETGRNDRRRRPGATGARTMVGAAIPPPARDPGRDAGPRRAGHRPHPRRRPQWT